MRVRLQATISVFSRLDSAALSAVTALPSVQTYLTRDDALAAATIE